MPSFRPIQLTRHPSGLGHALLRIGGVDIGSIIRNRNAEEASHFFFADGVLGLLGTRSLSTHPPLKARVERILPGVNVEEIELADGDSRTELSHMEEALGFAGQTEAPLDAQPDAVGESIGNPNARHLERARALLASIDEELRTAARDPVGAQAICLAVLVRDQRHLERYLSRRHG